MAEPDPDLARKALTVHDRLAALYGAPFPYFQDLDPLSELVSTLLNHRTRNRAAKAAFLRLRERLPSWEAVRDAPLPEIEKAIAGVTWPEAKAPRLREALRAVEARAGRLDLAFLGEMPVAEARAWLEAIPGVGPKTSAAVLSFSSLRRPALPVDSHHHRVAQRIGLIGPRVDVGPSHAILETYLPQGWDAQQVYDHHQLYMRHGQKTCHWRGPDCDDCAVRDLCDWACARTGSAGRRRRDGMGRDDAGAVH
jgi:endonuclease-3